MIDPNDLKVGLNVYWQGSAAVKTYGNRKTPATILEIKDHKRIKIKIDTPKGTITKFVSHTSLAKIE